MQKKGKTHKDKSKKTELIREQWNFFDPSQAAATLPVIWGLDGEHFIWWV